MIPTSVEYARAVISTEFNEYTHREDSEQFGKHVTTNSETKQEEEHSFAKGDFYKFDPGEAVVCRQGNGWVHGRVHMLGK